MKSGPPISELDSKRLLELVTSRNLDEFEALKVLRSPFCTLQIAEMLADDRSVLDGHAVRERLAGFPGFNLGRAMDLLGSLPWTSLLSLAQSPKTPPVIRRQAERKIMMQLPNMTLGERVALARRAHRALVNTLIAHADPKVLSALLNNPRLVENDILVMINTGDPPPEFFAEVARHHKWGQYFRVRRALVVCPSTPYPLALSVLVQLPKAELRRALNRPDLPENVRQAVASLLEREAKGLRRVIDSSRDVRNGGGAQPSEDLR